MIFLWRCRKAVFRTTGATSHGNRHSLAAKLPDISLLVKHMTEDSLFREQLGRTGLQSNLQQSAFPDLFADSTVRFATGLELSRYVYAARGNWNNYKPDDEVAASDKENDEETEDIEGPPDDPYALYGVYN